MKQIRGNSRHESEQTSDRCWISGKSWNDLNHKVWIDGDDVTDGLMDVRRSTSSYREGNGCSHYRMLHGILSMLEPYEVKVSRTVLRELGAGNSLRLPDTSGQRGFLKIVLLPKYSVN